MSDTPATPPEKKPAAEDSEIAKKALARLRALARGNGIEPEAIALGDFDGETIDFEACGVFKLDPGTTEKFTPGREQGEAAGSIADAQTKVNTAIGHLARDRDVRKLTVSLLKKRPDLGFAVPEQTMRLDRFNKKYVVYESCVPCDASGETPCPHCHGKKTITCVKCHGQRNAPCHVCHGTQFISTPQGRKQCTFCHGRGRVRCDMCQQTGENTCPKCKAKGKVACRNCAGTGWNSRVFHLGLKARNEFIYDRAALPPDLPPIIDSYGPRLVTESHAHVRIVEDNRKDEELDAKSAADEYAVPYHVRLPWGDIGFFIKGEPLKGKLFGFTPLLLNLPPFLEPALQPGIISLREAASGRGSVAGHVKEALRYRLLGETFLLALRQQPKKAAAMLQARYPFGINPPLLFELSQQAKAALARLTQKPRLIGLMLGGVAAAAFTGTYFVGPLRESLVMALPPRLPDLLADLPVLIADGTAIAAAAQLSAAGTVKKTLAPVIARTKGKPPRLTPPPGPDIICGVIGGAVLFAAILAFAVSNGAPAPDWLAAIQRKF